MQLVRAFIVGYYCTYHYCLSYVRKQYIYKALSDFCRAMLCISAAIAVMRCPTVCLSVCHVPGSCQNE